MTLKETIQTAWGWCGFEVASIDRISPFGNVLFADTTGRYWRVCPEDLWCRPVADNQAGYDALWQDETFVEDWKMSLLVAQARETLGDLDEGECYALKIWGAVGGPYLPENLTRAPLEDVIRMAGDVAFQIRDLPDGAPIEFRLGA